MGAALEMDAVEHREGEGEGGKEGAGEEKAPST